MANEFLHKKLSEREREKIKNQAKEIMNNFANKLKNIKEIKTQNITKKEFERKENIVCEKKINREIMFKNAPNKNKNFILAEKKKW